MTVVMICEGEKKSKDHIPEHTAWRVAFEDTVTVETLYSHTRKLAKILFDWVAAATHWQ